MRQSFREAVAEIDERRHLLVARSHAQRLELADHCRDFERPLQWVGVGLRIAQQLRARPLLAAASGAVAVLTAIGLSRWRQWILRAVSVYQLGKFLRLRLGRTSPAT